MLHRMRYTEDKIFEIEKAVKKVQFKDKVDKSEVCETVLDIIANMDYKMFNVEWETQDENR